MLPLGPHYTITREELEKCMSSDKKRLFIDVAVPVDMDPEIREYPGITLYMILTILKHYLRTIPRLS